MNELIRTPCPSCGNRTLFIGDGGHLTCSWLKCREPGTDFAITAIKERALALEDLVLWALGEVGDDFPLLPPDWPKRKFYWRHALREKLSLIALSFGPATVTNAVDPSAQPSGTPTSRD